MAKDATDDRLTALEDAVRVLATTAYAPNGGGPDHVAEAAALYARLNPQPEPVAVEEPAAEAEQPAPESVAAESDATAEQKS